MTGHDRVDILLDLDRDYQTYYRFQVDHRGCLAEDCWGDKTWNPKYFVGFDATDTGWTAEIAIPFIELTGDRHHTARSGPRTCRESCRVRASRPGAARPTTRPVPKAWAYCNSGPTGDCRGAQPSATGERHSSRHESRGVCAQLGHRRLNVRCRLEKSGPVGTEPFAERKATMLAIATCHGLSRGNIVAFRSAKGLCCARLGHVFRASRLGAYLPVAEESIFAKRTPAVKSPPFPS